MIKIQRHFGEDIICISLSSDPMDETQTKLLCQFEDGDLEEIYHKEIKHISAYESNI